MKQTSRIYSWRHLAELLAANGEKPLRFYRVMHTTIFVRWTERPDIILSSDGIMVFMQRTILLGENTFYGEPGRLYDELAFTNYWEAYAEARKHGQVDYRP